MKRIYLISAFILSLSFSVFAQSYPLKICSFNIQFLGMSKDRDDTALTDLLKGYDLVAIQELVAPPYPGKYPNGDRFVPDPEAAHFFNLMQTNGFAYVMSAEDSGPGVKIHVNSSATEWSLVFYKPQAVKIAKDLPSGFLSKVHAHSPNFDRVPSAFGFRTIDGKMDFVLIPVHLHPDDGRPDKIRRKQELDSISAWIQKNDKKEKDFIILGDMNLTGPVELANVLPTNFRSLNEKCLPTNTNPNGEPYDHVMYNPTSTKEIISDELNVVNLAKAMQPYWKLATPYPGDPNNYKHDEFRKYYSDHNPVEFQMRPLSGGDDD